MCRPTPAAYINREEHDNLPKAANINIDEPRDVEDGYYSCYVDEDDSITPSRPQSNIIRGFLSWYSSQMDCHPLLTKSITGGCSAIIGDILAQYIEYNYDRIRDEEPEGFHVWRTIAMFMTGLTYGPMLHYVYEFYEHVFPIDCDKMLMDGCKDSVEDDDDDRLPPPVAVVVVVAEAPSLLDVRSKCPLRL